MREDALRLVQENVHDLGMNQRGLLSFGILAALWTSPSAVTAIMAGLKRGDDVDEGRALWKIRAYAILLTIGLSRLSSCLSPCSPSARRSAAGALTKWA
jgi:uncharacterized BrkB/YihY/UPF0761 family membrane protein